MSASIPNQAVIDSVVKSGEDPSLPHAVFLSLLREHVLPRLAPISAADQRQISAAFERERSKAKAAKDLLDSIALDKRESHLVSLVKKLEQSVRRDWHDGYESQEMLHNAAARAMKEWIILLHGIVHGSEDVSSEIFITVHKALIRMNNCIKDMLAINSRIQFEGFRIDPYILKDSEKRVLYMDCRFQRILLKFWRDLLLRALSLGGHAAFVSACIRSLEAKDFISPMLKYIRTGNVVLDGPEPGPKRRSETMYWDDHWHDATLRSAVPKLLSICHESRVAAFKMTPTATLFNQLSESSPQLIPSMIEIVKAKLPITHANGHHNTDLTKADKLCLVAVYTSPAGTDPERLLKLAKMLDGDYFIKWAVDIQQKAILHAGKQGPEWRRKAFKELKAGLEGSVRMIRNEINECFPYLEEEVKRAGPTDEAKDRADCEDDEEYEYWQEDQSENVDRIASRAMGGAGFGFFEDGPLGFRDDGLDNLRPDDPDYEEESSRMRCDYASIIKSWAETAKQWPDEAEKQELLSKSMQNFIKDYGLGELLTIKGLAEAMASRLDYDYDHSDLKIHVANGIRALYEAFGPPTS